MLSELRKTIPLAYPLILSNLTQVAFGLIDTAMVGAVDYLQLAAAGLVVNVVAIPQVIGMGITMGVSPLVAMANGQGDKKRAASLFYNGFIISTVAGILLAIILFLGRFFLTHLNQDPAVVQLAIPYFSIMGISLFPMIVFLAMKQFADGLEYTKTGMTISLIALPVNAFLCWVFIFGNLGMPRMELVGAGVATLATRILQAIAMAVVLFNHRIFKPYIQLRKEAWILKKETIKELLHIGVPSSLQYAMESGAFSVSGIMIGWLGATVQAAHQIALNLASFTFMVSVGLSLAGSIRVSNAFGQQNIPLMRKIGVSTLVASLAYGVVCAILFILFRDQLPYIFNTDPTVINIAASLLLLAAVFQLSDASQAVGVGLLRGIKDVKRPTLYVAIAYWIIGIPIGYLLSFHFKMGAAGIWLGFVAGLTASSILLNHRFIKKTST